MDRRAFLNLSGGAAATAAVKIPLPKAEEIALARYLHSAEAQTSDEPKTYGVTVTSEFMEDYTSATPWVPAMKIEIPYVSKDGTAQIFSFSGSWSGQGSATIDRIHPDPDPGTHPDQTTLSGWSVERTSLPSSSFWGPDIYTPQALIVPGTPDRLMVFRRYSVAVAPLAADGTVGRVTPMAKSASIALSTGQLPAGSYYAFESFVHEARDSGGQNLTGALLRDLTTLQAIPIDGLSYPYGVRTVYPMRGVSPNYYRCVVHEREGGVRYLEMELDRSDPAKPIFRVLMNWGVGSTPGPISQVGCVSVHEPQVGQVLITLFDFPGLRSFRIDYVPYLAGPDKQTNVYNTPVNDQGPGPLAPSYPPGTTIETRSLWNSDRNVAETILLIRPPNAAEVEMWSMAHAPGKAWEPLSLVDKGLRDVAIFDAPEVTMLISRPRTGFEIWTREAADDWNSEHVRVETEDSQMREIAGYRVGVTMQADGRPAGGEEIGVTTSLSSSGVIQSTHCALGIHRPFKAKTDATGTLWITLLLEDRISFPSLILTSPRFKDRLVLDLNHKIETFVSNVTDEDLLKARDHRRCTDRDEDACAPDEIQQGLTTGDEKHHVTDSEKAKKAAELMRRTMAAAPKQAFLDPDAPGNLGLVSDIRAGWVPHHVDVRAMRQPGEAHLAPAWRLSKRDGEAHIELISRQEASVRMAELHSLYPRAMRGVYPAGGGGLFDFVTDAIDEIGNLGHALYDAACDVVEVVADGLKMVINLVVDGFNFIYNVVLDTIEQIMDAIEFFLDYAGMLVGMAIGWLLEQLGFLFDWKGIKERRNRYRKLVEDGVVGALNKLGDPRTAVAGMKTKLVTAKSDLHQAFNKFRSTRGEQENMGQREAEEPNGPDLSFVNGMAILPHLTWLMDKVQSAIPRRRSKPGNLGLDNLQQLTIDFGNAMSKFINSLGPCTGDAVKLIDSWIVHGELFSSSAMDPVLNLIESYIDRLLDALAGVLDAGSKLLGAFFDNPERVIGWLDAKISVPFFAGLYRGLTGNDLSCFDVACLIAAIPAAIHRDETTERVHAVPPRLNVPGWREGPQPAYGHLGSGGPHLVPASFERTAFAGGGVGVGIFQSELGQACAAFSIAGCIVDAITAGFTAAMPPDSSSTLGYAFTGVDIAISGCLWTLDLILEGPKWEQVAVANLMEVAATALLMAFGVIGEIPVADLKAAVKAGMKRVDSILAVLVLVNFARAMIMATEENIDQMVALIFDVQQKLVSLAIRQRESSMGLNSIGVGIFVGVLSGLRTAIYLERPAGGS